MSLRLSGVQRARVSWRASSFDASAVKGTRKAIKIHDLDHVVILPLHCALTLLCPFPALRLSITLLYAYPALRLPCCTLISAHLLRTLPCLIFPHTYPAVPLFFCALTPSTAVTSSPDFPLRQQYS